MLFFRRKEEKPTIREREARLFLLLAFNVVSGCLQGLTNLFPIALEFKPDTGLWKLRILLNCSQVALNITLVIGIWCAFDAYSFLKEAYASEISENEDEPTQ